MKTLRVATVLRWVSVAGLIILPVVGLHLWEEARRASWLLNVTYGQGKVTTIRAFTEDGPFLPLGFPPNEP